MFHNVNNELLRLNPNSNSSSSSSFEDLISTAATKASSGSEITTDDIYGICNGTVQREETPISQFASRVLEFSSQYGSDNSISYTACNITGRPSKFPNYGDFPETFAMVSDTSCNAKVNIRSTYASNHSIGSYAFFCSALMVDGGTWRLLAQPISCRKRLEKTCHKISLVINLCFIFY